MLKISYFYSMIMFNQMADYMPPVHEADGANFVQDNEQNFPETNAEPEDWENTLYQQGNTSVIPAEVMSMISVAGGLSGTSGGFSALEQNVIVYVCGYLSRKTMLNFPCDFCYKKQVVSLQSVSEDDNYVFVMRKQFETLSENQGLFAPSADMISFVQNMESVVSVHLEVHMHGTGIIKNILKEMYVKVTPDDVFCSSCQSSFYYMSKLYVKVRLFSVLKRHNQAEKGKGVKRNRKMLKLTHV